MTVRELMNIIGFKVDDKGLKEAETSIGNLKNFAVKALGAIGIGFSAVALKNFAMDSIQVASDVREMQEKFNTVFNGMQEEAEEWAEAYSNAVGRSKSTVQTYMADMQNLLVGFTDYSEEARRESMFLSEQMTELAIDLASFANTSEDEAIHRMTKAVMGESEAAKGLGAVLNDVTRAQAMERMGLEGKYQKLDQYTKMLVNFNAIQSQSQDAIGDATRSMGKYESQTRSLAAKQKDLQVFVGTQLMPVFQELNKIKSKMVDIQMKLAKAILGETEEDNKLLKFLQWVKNKYQDIQPVIERTAEKIKNFIEAIGGIETVVRLVIISFTLFQSAMLAMKVASFVKDAEKVHHVMSLLKNTFSVATLKLIALVAVFLLIALAVEDFITFLQGGDSIIGSFFESIGINGDEARTKIFEILGKIKDIAISTFEAIEAVILPFIETVKTAMQVGLFLLQMLWSMFGDTILKTIKSTVDNIVQVLTSLLSIIQGILNIIIGIFTLDLDLIKEGCKLVFDGIFAIISGIINQVITFLSGHIEIAMTIFNNLFSFLKGLFGSLATKALEWGKDFIDGLIQGIRNGIAKVKEAVTNVADAIKSVIHFSRPDEGPLRDYETYMPDMMDGLSRGIKANKNRVISEMKSLAAEMSMLAQSTMASPNAIAQSSVSNISNTVVQTNNFNNSYSGGSMEAQRAVSFTMKKSANDTTTQLARAMNFSRG